jgi:transposase
MLRLGIDVHKDSFTLAVLPADASAPIQVYRLPNDLQKLRRYRMRHAPVPAATRVCYEASGAGYVLQRALTEWGYHCEVIAPSLIPKRAGVRRKHDRRDAVELARHYRAGELVVIRVPSAAEERVRDLVRCRETFQREMLKSRRYVLKALARRGVVYRAGRHWTSAHERWLRQVLATSPELGAEDRLVLGEYLALLDYKLQRRMELERQLEQLVLAPAMAWLRCFRGIQRQSALVLATEIVDWRRFEKPRQLMAYLGLVPREHSSGDRERRGAITKAGNRHCRHVLVQAAWAYRW